MIVDPKDNPKYKLDTLIVLSSDIINMYGYVRKTEIDRLARLQWEKSNISGAPLDYKYVKDSWGNPTHVDFNKTHSTTERVLDYYKGYTPKEGDAEKVKMIKADFKRLVLKILGGTATSFQQMTASILNKEYVEDHQVGIVCSWPYIVEKRKEKVDV